MKIVPRNQLDANVTIADIEAMRDRVKNWGRWGDDDEIGTLNFVTEAEIMAARDTIRKGKVISLGLPFDKDGPQRGGRAGSIRSTPCWRPVPTR